MAAALVDFARSNSVEPKTDRVSEFQMFPGEGIYGEIDGRSLYIGNQRIAARAGCAAGRTRRYPSYLSVRPAAATLVCWLVF